MTRKPRPLSLSQQRMLATLLAGPRAYATRRTVCALLRRGMVEVHADGHTIELSHWGRIHALKVRSNPQVAGWVSGGIMETQ